MTQIPQPQLGGFATASNCNLVTGPSSYSAASGIGYGCGQVMPTGYYAQPVQYVAPPAQIAAPAVMPPVGAPISQYQTGTGGCLSNPTTGAPAPSLFTLGQERFPVQVGQGLWGQPVAYVPGQGLRNWIRYMFP
ncbi:hypothetical protein [Stieleria varia]|nr:hypothetical protein [Stieleria varia]